MTKFTAKARLYLALAIIGIIFLVYSIKIRNLILLVASVLFAAVSADNISCNLRK